MQYKATLDKSAKIITTLVLLLFSFLSLINLTAVLNSKDIPVILTYAAIGVLLDSILFVCYLFAPQSYRIDSTALIIVRPISNKKIPFTEIEEIRSIDDGEAGGAIRTFGVGGLFGYYGRFNYDKVGNVTMYATQSGNKILLTTREGKKIIITPDDRDGFLEEFHLKLRG